MYKNHVKNSCFFHKLQNLMKLMVSSLRKKKNKNKIYNIKTFKIPIEKKSALKMKLLNLWRSCKNEGKKQLLYIKAHKSKGKGKGKTD